MARRQTLKQAFTATTIVKKSRFAARAAPAATEAEAQALIAEVREPKANHNCWAYRLDGGMGRHSDDREPAGTAGGPIAAALAAGNFVRVAVVVTRYSGGIKLGTGALARAYGGAAAQCLAQAPRAECVPTADARVAVNFEHVGAVFMAAQRYTRLDSAFLDAGCVLRVRVLESEREEFTQRMRDASKGTAVVEFEIEAGGAKEA